MMIVGIGRRKEIREKKKRNRKKKRNEAMKKKEKEKITLSVETIRPDN